MLEKRVLFSKSRSSSSKHLLFLCRRMTQALECTNIETTRGRNLFEIERFISESGMDYRFYYGHPLDITRVHYTSNRSQESSLSQKNWDAISDAPVTKHSRTVQLVFINSQVLEKPLLYKLDAK